MLCNSCPRSCNIDRSVTVGFCRMGDNLKLARAALHFWEEPCISGENGSGAVFFSGCNMACVYCQNKEVSKDGFGRDITVNRLAKILIELQQKGAHNINLVTPTHFATHIIKAVEMAKEQGMSLPIIYNTSGFEKIEAIKLLEKTVDVYLPDFKYFDEEVADRYSLAKGYVATVKKAIQEMVHQKGQCVFNKEGGIISGVIVRVLVLPNQKEEAKKIIEYLYEKYGDNIFISIMNQYTPCTDLAAYPEINRKITKKEYDDVVDFACKIGVENGFIQEGGTAKESFIPKFDTEGV